MKGDRRRPEGLQMRMIMPGGFPMGPGKADLLQGIAETGSISAAGRRMKMSYRRAWSLVEDMNGFFREPLVETSRGGADGGGARLTEMGERALTLFRRIEEKAMRATGPEQAELTGLLRDASKDT